MRVTKMDVDAVYHAGEAERNAREAERHAQLAREHAQLAREAVTSPKKVRYSCRSCHSEPLESDRVTHTAYHHRKGEHEMCGTVPHTLDTLD